MKINVNAIKYPINRWLKYVIWSLLVCFTMLPSGQAQKDDYRIEHVDTFGKLRRPPVKFGHQAHVDALENKGCGVCHHTPVDAEKLNYVEGQEDSCLACHGKHKENRIPALREAYHGSCTPCHRNMKKVQTSKSGPTTCGECHRPE